MNLETEGSESQFFVFIQKMRSKTLSLCSKKLESQQNLDKIEIEMDKIEIEMDKTDRNGQNRDTNGQYIQRKTR